MNKREMFTIFVGMADINKNNVSMSYHCNDPTEFNDLLRTFQYDYGCVIEHSYLDNPDEPWARIKLGSNAYSVITVHLPRSHSYYRRKR